MQQEELIKQLEQINEYIEQECEGNMSDLSEINRSSYEKFRNASLLLLNNALRLYRGQSSLIATPQNHLTLLDIKELMIKIYQVLTSADFISVKEEEICKHIKNFNINPADILVANPSSETEYLKNMALLNGTL